LQFHIRLYLYIGKPGIPSSLAASRLCCGACSAHFLLTRSPLPSPTDEEAAMAPLPPSNITMNSIPTTSNVDVGRYVPKAELYCRGRDPLPNHRPPVPPSSSEDDGIRLEFLHFLFIRKPSWFTPLTLFSSSTALPPITNKSTAYINSSTTRSSRNRSSTSISYVNWESSPSLRGGKDEG
jgi:hypothetical protein